MLEICVISGIKGIGIQFQFYFAPIVEKPSVFSSVVITFLSMSNECHETATVTRILDDHRVQVVVKRSEACGACSARGACQALGGGQTKDFFLELDNSVGADVGDVVRLTLSEGAVIQASAILYLIPAIGLLALALIGSALAPSLELKSDLGAVIGAMVGLVVGFGISWLLAKSVEKTRKAVPVITRVETRIGD
jgi:sigma-E factor negative regulatory protein RseC